MRTFGRSGTCSGFTLVELLITITIIGLLATIVMGGLSYARQMACEAATKATIAKLHNIIMEKYESYQTRRVPITPTGTRVNAARVRLDALRDLMRMELPERASDVERGPLTAIRRPAMWEAYRRLFDSKGTPKVSVSAKMLYMIVSLTSPEAMEQFSRNEIAIDTDGWPMFVDAWGTPIKFLRWAPGFNASDIQPNIVDWQNNITDPRDGKTERQRATENDHDPYDPQKLDTSAKDDILNRTVPTGWRLVPLIYSAGRDKQYGINDVQDYNYQGNPYSSCRDQESGLPCGIGSPHPSNQHFDNVHNHHIEQR